MKIEEMKIRTGFRNYSYIDINPVLEKIILGLDELDDLYFQLIGIKLREGEISQQNTRLKIIGCINTIKENIELLKRLLESDRFIFPDKISESNENLISLVQRVKITNTNYHNMLEKDLTQEIKNLQQQMISDIYDLRIFIDKYREKDSSLISINMAQKAFEEQRAIKEDIDIFEQIYKESKK